MKLILTIIRDSDNEPVSQALIHAGFRVTRIASTGGLMRRGSSTLMIGTEDEKVDDAISLIRSSVSSTGEPGTMRATLFVLKVENFKQI
jgi:uncharacterized protein YaaQ